MKITDIKTYSLKAVLDAPLGWSKHVITSRTASLVRISTDEGVEGWGEIAAHGQPSAGSAVIGSILKPMLIGKDPLATSALWQEMYELVRVHGLWGMQIEAISAVDIALWDIKGKATNLPIYSLLGGPFREKVRAYATGLYYSQEGNQVESRVEEARSYIEEGFSAMKMKIGGLSVKEDIANVAAVRDAIGEDTLLMVDANGAYNRHAAKQVGRLLEELGVTWFEEPVPAEDVDGYAALRSALDVAITGGENSATRFAFRDFIARRAVDILQPDLCIAGGLTECRRIADAAGMWGIQCIPHTWGTQVAIAASLQFIAALPDLPAGGGPCFPLRSPMLEFDRTPNPIRDRLVVSPIEHQQGWVSVPDRPGLGIDIDEDALQMFCVNS